MSSPLMFPARASTFSTPHRAHPPPISHSDSLHVTPRDDTKIYVLTADGSSLFLLDQTKPGEAEEPPPYAAYHAPAPQASPSPIRTLPPSGIVRIASPPPRIDFARLHSSASLALPGPISGPGSNAEAGPSRSRASTISAIHVPRRSNSAGGGARRGARPRLSGMRGGSEGGFVRGGHVDESTPLLGDGPRGEAQDEPTRGLARSIFCGDVTPEEGRLSWRMGFKRFWAPIGRAEYWFGLIHLLLLNFPFALAVWPPLLVGTLVGTVLLITLPIGLLIWWLTLFIARSAARLEIKLQTKYHSPFDSTTPIPSYRPIFHRLRAVSPHSPLDETGPMEDRDVEYVWHNRFFKCSYAMFLDHYSYSALSYFLLIKPLLTLFSFVGLIVLLPVGAATIVGLPVVLRAARHWAKWQAGIAFENLC